jgi:hypothetical protein
MRIQSQERKYNKKKLKNRMRENQTEKKRKEGERLNSPQYEVYICIVK